MRPLKDLRSRFHFFRFCDRCGKKFKPTGRRQMICVDCYDKRYRRFKTMKKHKCNSQKETKSCERKIDTPVRAHNSKQGCDSSPSDSPSDTSIIPLSEKKRIVFREWLADIYNNEYFDEERKFEILLEDLEKADRQAIISLEKELKLLFCTCFLQKNKKQCNKCFRINKALNKHIGTKDCSLRKDGTTN